MNKIAALAAIITTIMVFGCTGTDNGNVQKAQSSIVQETAIEEEELVLSFAGDIMFDKSVAKFIKAKGADYIFQGYEKYLMNSDIVFGNLETPLSNGGQPVIDKEYTFRSSPELAPFLKKYNFTAVSIANNHALDYGRGAFIESMKVLKENGISYGGGGHNKKEATDGVIIEKEDVSVGFIAFTSVVPDVDWYAGEKRAGIIGGYKVHEAEVLKAVATLDSKCDILVVSMHWGKEGTAVIGKREAELAHKLVDAGADVIQGHHPHVVQGFEVYNEKLILYSLGNFIFTTSFSEISNQTVLATARFDKTGKLKSVEAVPGIIKGGRPNPMDQFQSRAYLDYLNNMNINVDL